MIPCDGPAPVPPFTQTITMGAEMQKVAVITAGGSGMGAAAARRLAADGFAVLQSAKRPDGTRNPLYQPVRYIELEGAAMPWRQRRVCCIRYLLPELELCENCPLLDTPPALTAGALD